MVKPIGALNKRARQALERRDLNRQHRSKLRSAVRTAQAAIDSKNRQESIDQLDEELIVLKSDIIHYFISLLIRNYLEIFLLRSLIKFPLTIS